MISDEEISNEKIAAIEAAAKKWVDVAFPNHPADFATCGDVANIIARLRDAEAIVAKLTKTADGVPVVPGMSLWYLIGGVPEMAHFNSDAIPHDATAYYSTEAAALAVPAPSPPEGSR